MATDTTNADSTDEESTFDNAETVMQTKPSIKPTAIRMGLLLLTIAVVSGLFATNPQLLGSADLTRTASLIVLLLGIVIGVRYLVELVILVNTTYIVKKTHVERRYSLLFRTYSRGVWFTELRSHELTQSRIQSILGFGTVSLNQGLGDLRLTDVEQPHTVYRLIQDCTTEGMRESSN